MTTPRLPSLAAGELALWHAFKQAGESVRAAVGEEIARATGLSDPDFGILTRLADAGGSMRQNELAASMGWQRSRLSHQLTRMQTRGLVVRADPPAAVRGVTVEITDAGRAAAVSARPVHAVAVRRHLLDRLPVEDFPRLIEVLSQLAQASAQPPFRNPG